MADDFDDQKLRHNFFLLLQIGLQNFKDEASEGHVNYVITMSVLRELRKCARQPCRRNAVTGRMNQLGDRGRGQRD